jgi:HlyD family secretion protein
MSTETPPNQPGRPQPQDRLGCSDSVLRRWWRRGLLAIGAIGVVVAAATLIPDATSSGEIGPKLTHTIKRGDLVVTVTERGTLESSENAEVKCEVRGQSTVIWVIEGGSVVESGDELVRLDTLRIENAVNERTKYALWSRSGAERSRANVARAELAISEYLEGRYRSQLMTMEKDLAIAESDLRTRRNMSAHATRMAERGYISDLEAEEKAFRVTQAELNVEVRNTEIGALKDFSKEMEMETLRGDLKAAKADLAASEERAKQDAVRRDEALEEFELCVIKAETGGLVIHPSAAKWKTAPEIEEGSTVHKDQVLLLMPDLAKMQVKIEIHESVIDRIKPGLAARVRLPNKTLTGEVDTVSSVTAPSGWSGGDEAKYDTIVELPSVRGLMPGMSAEVEVLIDSYKDVLTIPVAAVVETEEGDFCWVKADDGPTRRSIKLGDTNDLFTVVKAGLKEGDQVMLNPFAFTDEKPTATRKPVDATEDEDSDTAEAGGKEKPKTAGSDKPARDTQKKKTKPQAAKSK